MSESAKLRRTNPLDCGAFFSELGRAEGLGNLAAFFERRDSRLRQLRWLLIARSVGWHQAHEIPAGGLESRW
jgi:hypothetical protein